MLLGGYLHVKLRPPPMVRPRGVASGPAFGAGKEVGLFVPGGSGTVVDHEWFVFTGLAKDSDLMSGRPFLMHAVDQMHLVRPRSGFDARPGAVFMRGLGPPPSMRNVGSGTDDSLVADPQFRPLMSWYLPGLDAVSVGGCGDGVRVLLRYRTRSVVLWDRRCPMRGPCAFAFSSFGRNTVRWSRWG